MGMVFIKLGNMLNMRGDTSAFSKGEVQAY